MGAWLATILASGCYHLVMPVSPPRLPDDVSTLRIEPRCTVRLVNGYTEAETVWFRTEGIHHIGADLREWTDRLLSELQIELEPRGVSTLIDRGAAASAVSDAALRIRITSIVPPRLPGGTDSAGESRSDQGPLLEATIESEDGGYRGEFASSATAHGFSDALFSLKESILVDGNLAAWFSEAATFNDQAPSPNDQRMTKPQ
jgi:hypothetical protein